MPGLPVRRVAAAVALSAAGLACDGSTPLSPPPDGARCTKGTLSVGDTVSGAISVGGCLLTNAFSEEETVAESWTLRTAPNTVYIVRMVPTAADSVDIDVPTALHLFGRDESGDPVFVSANSGGFSNPAGSGPRGRELVIVSRTSRTYSVRVTTSSAEAAFEYRLIVAKCPLRVVTVGQTSAPVAVDGSCTMNGIEEFPNTAVAFFSYDGSAGQQYTIVGTDVAESDAHFRLRKYSPRDDFGCYTDGCERGRVTSGSIQGTITLQAPSPLTTDYTVLVSRVAGTGLSVTLGVTPTPTAAVTQR